MNVVPATIALSCLCVFPFGAWVEGTIIETMNAHVEDRVILIEDLRGAISHMDIPIENADLLLSELFLCIASGHCDIVKEAESSHIGAASMMARRSHDTESRVHLTPEDSPHTLYGSSGSQVGTGCGVFVLIGIILEPFSVFMPLQQFLVVLRVDRIDRIFHFLDVRHRVHIFEVLVLGRLEVKLDKLLIDPLLDQVQVYGHDTLWPLGVIVFVIFVQYHFLIKDHTDFWLP